jgi:hypothetical protein
MSEIRITRADCKHRNSGAYVCDAMRKKFFLRFGLDWDRFKTEGLSPAEMRAPGQHLDLIDRLEVIARARIAATAGPCNG